MPGDCRNIYKTARRAAGLTQEAAAEKLGISVESVRAYENDQRTPPSEVVELMVICYNAQHLAYQHLRETNTLMARVVPQIEQRPLPEAVMELVDSIYRFADQHRDRQLIAIAKDGVIDDAERPKFDAIAKELEELVQAAMALRCAQE